MAQGRRVRRVIRKLDTWSVLKVSVLFYLSLVVVVVLAGVLLWLVGSTVGAIDNVEKFMRAIGFENFRFVGSQLHRGAVGAGVVLVVR
jgi:cytochrome c biogenesis protein CcdA